MMLFEIRWTPDNRPMARRTDGQPLTDQDRQQIKALLEKMERREVCTNCGAVWSEVVADIEGRHWRVCWSCAKSI